ncbi:MAG: molybdopterin biosynthesis protein [Oscillospiraceae bacterium]|nr:molybdopterin biosynthesis protein [Oscillospiraceae bacterium]
MPKRNLYLKSLPVEEAITRFQDALSPYLKAKSEDIEVIRALDRITSEAVYARCSSPLYNCAAMDGIAVISDRTRGASETAPLTLKEPDFVAVDTGDPIRPPYDAVIMAEDILETVEDNAVTIRFAASPWQHVRPVGEDIVSGEMILPGGHQIRPVDIGVLLSGGITRLSVYIRPSVAVIPTGTEMIEPGEEMVEGSIIESNSRMLEALVRHSGGEPERFSPVPDEYERLKSTLQDVTGRFDMALIIAGTSAGRDDYTASILRELGNVVVHGVNIKPGKPVILAVVNGKPVIGVPGYPVSAYLAYETFAAPVLSRLSRSPAHDMPIVKATLTRKLVSSLKHREYVRVKIGQVGGRLVASPLARGAGAAMSLVRADGFCIIGQDEEGVHSGVSVDVLLCRRLSDLQRTVVSVGSHDLILDVLSDLMPRLSTGSYLSSTHVGSMGGLLALKNGESHIAPVHLLDEDTGEYNIPVLKKLFTGKKMALIKGVGRVQGLIVQKGNPLNIGGLEDLTKCRYINRQRGAGTRLLFDSKLKVMGIPFADIPGYEREAATHMAVAAAVKNADADAGLGIFSAAKAMELDFIPVGEEEYDFAIPAEFLKLSHIQDFIKALQSAEFLKNLKALGGYAFDCCGEIIPVDC